MNAWWGFAAFWAGMGGLLVLGLETIIDRRREGKLRWPVRTLEVWNPENVPWGTTLKITRPWPMFNSFNKDRWMRIGARWLGGWLGQRALRCLQCDRTGRTIWKGWTWKNEAMGPDPERVRWTRVHNEETGHQRFQVVNVRSDPHPNFMFNVVLRKLREGWKP